ncbi:DUF2244 domain-containing protein [Rhodovulum sp. YNF3179]|uniref:DUF2244 domain-containing protein n=1 Tax=Rhodovulum sp. YNF3179 TaxID=3425127 RepID=UPI003D33062B
MPLEHVTHGGAPADAGAPSASEAPFYQVVLRPHRSLPPEGFAWVIAVACGFLLIPLIALLGTLALWAMLPFLIGTVWALWHAIRRNTADGALYERLEIGHDLIRVTRHEPRGDVREWAANPYWTKATLHEDGGPVPKYLTLKGGGREIELGAFLSPEERAGLFADLERLLAQAAQPPSPSPPPA